MVENGDSRLARVLEQLSQYEHPLLTFDARAKADTVEVVINFKVPPVPVHTYVFELHPRDLDNPQFTWAFQRQLYDCLHDYFIEMFTRTPQSRESEDQKLGDDKREVPNGC
ncbi:MAG TPA: hypothetical protein VN622_08835 [Clostridia bacterium]|nr:hypothetical protein [Clostridia bacterium]